MGWPAGEHAAGGRGNACRHRRQARAYGPSRRSPRPWWLRSSAEESVLLEHLWYVSYGSNLFADRFTCYIAGGRAPGGRWTNPGARDPSPPTGDRRVDLDHALVFGGPSHTWHGGPAYLDLVTPGHSVGRGWRITHEQFEDLVAQENKLDPGAVTIDHQVLQEGGVVLPGARYGRLVPLDPVDGEPAVTVTYIDRPTERAPDPNYLDLLQAGLEELGLAPGEARALLHTQPQLAARA